MKLKNRYSGNIIFPDRLAEVTPGFETSAAPFSFVNDYA